MALKKRNISNATKYLWQDGAANPVICGVGESGIANIQPFSKERFVGHIPVWRCKCVSRTKYKNKSNISPPHVQDEVFAGLAAVVVEGLSMGEVLPLQPLHFGEDLRLIGHWSGAGDELVVNYEQ